MNTSNISNALKERIGCRKYRRSAMLSIQLTHENANVYLKRNRYTCMRDNSDKKCFIYLVNIGLL